MRIDIKALSHKIKEAREDFERDLENGIADRCDYRDELRYMANANRFLWQAAPRADASSLRAELVTASVAAGQHGATDAQIDYIVSLAENTGDFNGLGSSHLTKAQASRIIDSMKG